MSQFVAPDARSIMSPRSISPPTAGGKGTGIYDYKTQADELLIACGIGR